ncbi:Cysteine oxygenase/2-aminoethanethiol dioxygenase [Parasponia andersonii]|uniref:cysteine dioxygenase n=1 Tax=Parasponia andersonii TaxID=3476 RepID=A0A2P5A5E2_PARAD|nr:Cysteine oxygenase/2-aminoethanethiol dioxygenase [Parasponia andersonii]
MVRHVSRVGYVTKVIGKRKSGRVKRSINMKPPKVPMALQQLFLTCRDVFNGPGTIPLPHHVNKLRLILDKMKAEDVGLSSDLQFFNPTNVVKGTPPRVTHTTIYECTNFSLCIFFIPANGVIPLHNHPGMTVFSKLLLGKMHIKSYDWVDQPAVSHDKDVHSFRSSSQLGLAKLKADSVFTAPCNTSVLYPTTGGNIHAFTAITPCAVLDVIGPPYSKEDDRDCSYYKDHPYSSFSNGEKYEVEEGESTSYAWLEEIEMPKDSQMDGIEYLGPQIMETSC